MSTEEEPRMATERRVPRCCCQHQQWFGKERRLLHNYFVAPRGNYTLEVVKVLRHQKLMIPATNLITVAFAGMGWGALTTSEFSVTRSAHPALAKKSLEN